MKKNNWYNPVEYEIERKSKKDPIVVGNCKSLFNIVLMLKNAPRKNLKGVVVNRYVGDKLTGSAGIFDVIKFFG
jgi:hypothetical protein